MSRTDKDAKGLRKARRIFGSTPPRQYINDVWTSRQRQAVRIDCHNVAKEHRADGHVDTEPSVDQHHHGVRSDWA